MEEVFKPFRCGECGYKVYMTSAKGETRVIRPGVEVPIPADIMIPKCEYCGETWYGPEDSARVDAACEMVYNNQQYKRYMRHNVIYRSILMGATHPILMLLWACLSLYAVFTQHDGWWYVSLVCCAIVALQIYIRRIIQKEIEHNV
jgi:hypothetical protein